MRRNPLILFLLAIIVTTLANCSKDKTEKEVNPVVYLPGIWELREASGQAGVFPFKKGNGHRLEFTKTDYRVIEADTLKQTGKYHLEVDNNAAVNVCTDFISEDFTHLLIYDGNPNDPKKYIRIVGNKLSYISGCFAFDSGHQLEYEKISDR